MIKLANVVLTNIEEYNSIIKGTRDFILTVSDKESVKDIVVGDLIVFHYGITEDAVSLTTEKDVLYKVKFVDNNINNGSMAIGFEKYFLIKSDSNEIKPKKFC